MPDFTAPEYASYVALCKELRLRPEGEWSLGDWVAYGSIVEQLDSRHALDSYEVPKDAVWLPQLADWMAMLEQEQIDTVTFKTNPAWPAEHRWSCEGELGEWWEGTGPTREKAAAKLWMTVTGK